MIEYFPKIHTYFLRMMAVWLLCAGLGPTAAMAQNSAAQTTAQINAIRAQAGLGAVARHPQLDAAAQRHARDMAANGFLSHSGSDGSDLRKRVERAGYRWCTLAENVSRGYRSDAGAIEAWRGSQGHYANITKRNAREFGYANVNGFRVLILSARRC